MTVYNKLIEAIASLEQSLDQLGDGLAYEILLACISIAASTRPEWSRIATILIDDFQTP